MTHVDHDSSRTESPLLDRLDSPSDDVSHIAFVAASSQTVAYDQSWGIGWQCIMRWGREVKGSGRQQHSEQSLSGGLQGTAVWNSEIRPGESALGISHTRRTDRL